MKVFHGDALQRKQQQQQWGRCSGKRSIVATRAQWFTINVSAAAEVFGVTLDDTECQIGDHGNAVCLAARETLPLYRNKLSHSHSYKRETTTMRQ